MQNHIRRPRRLCVGSLAIWIDSSMPVYNPDLPTGCPPAHAAGMEGAFYRRLKSIPATTKDFLSHRERGMPCEGDDCACWGISVWTNVEQVQHALNILGLFRKSPIARVSVTPADGVIAKTPTGRQPDHHTFWCNAGTDFATLCEPISINSGGA